MPPEPNLGNAVITKGYWGWLFTYTFVAVAALTALTYLHTKPSKIYERNFSWLWKTLKDLREWIKRPRLGWWFVQQVLLALLRLPNGLCRDDGREHCTAWLLEQSLRP